MGSLTFDLFISDGLGRAGEESAVLVDLRSPCSMP